MYTQRCNFHSRCCRLPPWRCGDAVFPNMVRGVTFPSNTWGIRPITMHLDSWPIRAHRGFQNDELFKKLTRFRKAGQRGATIMYSMWNITCFFNLKPRKHIALHQIHKIMLFLTTLFYPFKRIDHAKVTPSFFAYTFVRCYANVPMAAAATARTEDSVIITHQTCITFFHLRNTKEDIYLTILITDKGVISQNLL